MSSGATTQAIVEVERLNEDDIVEVEGTFYNPGKGSEKSHQTD